MQFSSDKAGSCGIAVMAKESFPGHTKTRLVPPLTYAQAAHFNTAFIRDMAETLLSVSDMAGVSGYVAYGPAGSSQFFERHVPAGIGLIEASRPNLGDCLRHALQAQFLTGHTAACVLNSDSPTLPASLLVEAASVLARPGDRIVLGPCTDGGYYLLGCKMLHRRLFEDIAWSTERVLSQTLERAAEIGVEVHLLPEWYDVDNVAALDRLAAELLYGLPFNPDLISHTAWHSAALLGEMRRTELHLLVGAREMAAHRYRESGLAMRRAMP